MRKNGTERDGLSRLQHELGLAPRTRRAAGLRYDDGGPVACEASVAWFSERPSSRAQGSSLRDLVADVGRHRAPATTSATPPPGFAPGTPQRAPAAPPDFDAPPMEPPAPAIATPELEDVSLPSPAIDPPLPHAPTVTDEPALEAPGSAAGTLFGEDSLMDGAALAEDLSAITGTPRSAPAARPAPARPAPPGPAPAGKDDREGDTHGDPHAVFDRIRDAKRSGSLASGDPSGVFDRIRQNAPGVQAFDVGSFEVRKRFDHFDRMLSSEVARAAEGAATQPPSTGAAEEVEVSEADLRADIAAIRGDEPPALRTPTPPLSPVHYESVPVVAEGPGLSSAAASAAMLVGWREGLRVIDPAELVAGTGPWAGHVGAIDAQGTAFFDAFGLRPIAPARHGPRELQELLEHHGPLWVRAASGGGSALVLAGIEGDGTPENTVVHTVDPAAARADAASARGTEPMGELFARLAASSKQPEDRRVVLAHSVQVEQVSSPPAPAAAESPETEPPSGAKPRTDASDAIEVAEAEKDQEKKR